MVLAASTVVAGILGAMYLDAKCLIRSDLHQLMTARHVLNLHTQAEASDTEHIYYRFRKNAKAQPDRVFLVFEGRKYTYRQLEATSNRLVMTNAQTCGERQIHHGLSIRSHIGCLHMIFSVVILFA
ncbi:hypothetical protein BX666DRAFT_1067716 [Dichotomocladium elegans]|nr:hypothetical protein BX666DRAFT_1067716 [Dichotomocladium elegans]